MWYSAVGFVVTLTLSLLVAPLTAEAQQATKVHRIGRLSSGSPTELNPNLEAFRQGLRELGYVEGQNLVIESRYAEGSPERLRDLAVELVQRKMDVIVAVAAAATRAAQHATRTIPIVMLVGVDPVAAGLIASLGHPGGNMTGVSVMTGELSGKQLEFLKEAVPTVSRIAVLANPTDPNTPPRLHYLQGVAHTLRVQLHVLEVQSREDVERAVAAAAEPARGAPTTPPGAAAGS